MAQFNNNGENRNSAGRSDCNGQPGRPGRFWGASSSDWVVLLEFPVAWRRRWRTELGRSRPRLSHLSGSSA